MTLADLLHELQDAVAEGMPLDCEMVVCANTHRLERIHWVRYPQYSQLGSYAVLYGEGDE